MKPKDSKHQYMLGGSLSLNDHLVTNRFKFGSVSQYGNTETPSIHHDEGEGRDSQHNAQMTAWEAIAGLFLISTATPLPPKSGLRRMS